MTGRDRNAGTMYIKVKLKSIKEKKRKSIQYDYFKLKKTRLPQILRTVALSTNNNDVAIDRI